LYFKPLDCGALCLGIALTKTDVPVFKNPFLIQLDYTNVIKKLEPNRAKNFL